MPADIKCLLKTPFKEENLITINAWYIDPEELGENFSIILDFLPQSYFYLGLLISGITLIVCILYTVYEKKEI